MMWGRMASCAGLATPLFGDRPMPIGRIGPEGARNLPYRVFGQ